MLRIIIILESEFLLHEPQISYEKQIKINNRLMMKKNAKVIEFKKKKMKKT